MNAVSEALAVARPRPAASLPVAGAALAAATAAAALLPGARPGLNVLIVAACCAGAVLAAFRLRGSWFAWTAGAAALCLAAAAAFTSSEWVLAVDLAAAVALAAVTVAAPSAWIELGLSGAMLGWRGVWSPLWLARSLPLGRGAFARATPLVRGLLAGGVLLALFGGLFAAADRAFAELAARWLVPDVDLGLLPARAVVFGLTAAFAGALCMAAPSSGLTTVASAAHDLTTSRLPRRVAARVRGTGGTEWVVALALLNALFAAFVAVQITVLFGGRAHVLETTGLTYAQYARSGFFQLVAVAFLVLGLVFVASIWGPGRDRRRRRAVRLLLGSLCILTLVVLASALRRLDLYEDAFGLTRLRISVHATILWLGALLALVLGARTDAGARWLPRAVVLLTAGSLMAFTLLRPDALIARRNVDRYERTGKIDVSYLATLSPDAVPVLVELPEPLRSCVLSGHGERLAEDDSLPSFNFSRAQARASLRAAPIRTDCPRR